MGFAEAVAVGGGGGGWGLVAKPCDYCNSAQALLFCRTDSAYMCMACDSRIHATDELGPRHERVWMCEVCEVAPASLVCKADAAALCVACDRDIHTANPLAERHERVAMVPFYDNAESVVKSTASTLLVHVNNSEKWSACGAHDGGYVIDPWNSCKATGSDNKAIEFLFSDSDNYLDFGFPNSSEARFEQQFCSVTDAVVPVQTIKPTVQPQLPIHSSEKRFGIDFSNSHINSYRNSYVPSLSQSVSSSSMDIGVVPDGSMSETSYPSGASVGASGGTQAAQLVGMDREARVLRYREKRKNRKFQKTIRYASRKAYAETRPRIKGRFAKRTEVDSHVDPMFSPNPVSTFFQDAGYGVVPSF